MRKFVVFCVVLMAVSITGYAQGGFTGPGRYRIEIVATGKSLDLKQEDGRTVQQWSGGGSAHQQWDVRDAGDGYYFIESVVNNLALDIEDSRSRDAVRVIVDRMNQSDSNQKWKIAESRRGQHTIISMSGRALESPAGSLDDGARLQASRPHGLENQRFIFVRVGDLPAVAGTTAGEPRPFGGAFEGVGRYQIQVVSSGKNLDLRREDNVTVQQWSGADVLNQKWDFEDAGDGYFYIRSAETGRYMEVADSRDGSPVRVNNFTGRDNQRWRLSDAGNGQYLIESRLGRVMDLAGSSRNDGTAVLVRNNRRQPNQLFRLARVEGAAAAPVQTVGRPRRGRPGDRSFGRQQEPYTPGNVRWRGRVDIEVLLEIRGSTVTEKLVGGRSFNDGRYTFSAAMPAREMDVRINNIKVRGTVELVEKPTPSNNFTAIVRIRDPQRDAADYEFELIW